MARNSNIEFKDNRVKIKAELDNALSAFLYEAAAAVQSQAERLTPVGSSQLKKSWDKVVDNGRMEATIGSPLEYAIYQEFGTGEYALEGNGRKGYWVFVKDNDTGDISRSAKSYTLAQAKRIMAMLRDEGLEAYYTNGVKPKRMLYKAMKMQKPKIEAQASKIFKSRGF